MPVRLATAQEKTAIDRQTHAAWGSLLTVEQFLAREDRLRATAWARAAMKTWVLVDDAGAIACSCETFQMPSRCADRDGHAHAIASVFTPEGARGKGHASRLLTEMMNKLVADEPSTQAFILSSEVGSRIYERLGFQLCPSDERILKASPDSTPGPTGLAQGPLLEEYSRHHPGKDAGEFVIWPTAAQVEWHFARQRIYAELLGRTPEHDQGAALGDALIGWMADYKSDCLRVLFLFASSGSDAEKLLLRARRAAHELRLPEVRIWETEGFSRWDQCSLPSLRRHRDDGLAMIRPVDPRANATTWRLVSRSTWV